MKSSLARLVSLVILTVSIVFLGITFYRVIAPFLLPLFLAAIIAALCQPIQKYFEEKTKGRVHLAAGLTTAVVIACIALPILLGTAFASLQLYLLATDTIEGQDWEEGVEEFRTATDLDHVVARVNYYFSLDITTEEADRFARNSAQKILASVSEKSLGLAASTLGVLGSVFSGIISLAMFVIALYYFLKDGPALLSGAEGLIPVDISYQRKILTQFNKVVRAVFVSTFVAAVSQGLLTALAILVVGWATDSPFLTQLFVVFLILATFTSLIPMAGAWLVWAPIALWLAITGHWFASLCLTLFGGVVIGTMDNVVRTYVLHTDAKLHPLLAFVCVLGGLKVMGLWGIFIGPIVASCLHALIQIFNDELKLFSKEQFTVDAEVRTTTPKKVDDSTGEGENAESGDSPEEDESSDDANDREEPVPTDSDSGGSTSSN